MSSIRPRGVAEALGLQRVAQVGGDDRRFRESVALELGCSSPLALMNSPTEIRFVSPRLSWNHTLLNSIYLNLFMFGQIE